MRRGDSQTGDPASPWWSRRGRELALLLHWSAMGLKHAPGKLMSTSLNIFSQSLLYLTRLILISQGLYQTTGPQSSRIRRCTRKRCVRILSMLLRALECLYLKIAIRHICEPWAHKWLISYVILACYFPRLLLASSPKEDSWFIVGPSRRPYVGA